MRKTDFKIFKEELEKIDQKDFFGGKIIDNELQNKFEKSINEYLDIKHIQKEKAVISIDIFQYSKYKQKKQTLIPMIFDLLKEIAKDWCKNDETAFFSKDDFDNNFINTGDGGFFIFNNPFQALIFNINFNTALHLFNSGHLYPKLFRYIGKITCRYCQTFDLLYKYNLNWFGPGIINNARIISKDKLDRFLIDENTYKWFLDNINGIETLAIIDISSVLETFEMQYGNYTSSIFRQALHDELIIDNIVKSGKKDQEPIGHFNNNYILNCNCLKIGEIKAKKDVLSVFNVSIQRIADITDKKDKTKRSQFIVPIGNLNASGLQVEP